MTCSLGAAQAAYSEKGVMDKGTIMPIVNSPHTTARRSGLIIGTFLLGVFVGQTGFARQSSPVAEKILVTTQSVVGEALVYPTSGPATITAQVVTLAPGAETQRHSHPMPTFGYILEGEIEVDYGPEGSKTFRKGEALMEAMAHVHQGRNVSDKRVRVLAVSIGAEGQPTAVAAKR